ncbi:MAG TPA: hypothetical protein VK116_12310, partial [Planctomycetota bacterium]|nr:hypothetical protein [Planctomycetota bacterium]
MLSDPCPASFREAKPPRSTAALLVLASVLFVAFAPAAGAAEDRDEIVLDGLFAARFASLEEASRRLGGRDPFVRAMGALDRRVRLGTDRDVDEEEYLRFARSAAREWGEDRERVAGALRSIAPALRKLELPWPATVTFVATSGDEEGGAAYCRDGAVFLPQPMIERVGDGLPRLIAHELFHILSSSRKDLRRAVYRALGATEARLELPKDMAARRITNPDAAGIDAVWRVEVDGEPGETLDVHAAPILLHRSTDDSKGAPFFRQLSLEFVAVEQASERTAPRTDEEAAVESALPLFRPKLRDGEPWLIPLRENASFWRSIGRNTSYIIHPEEVAADNFAHLVLSAKDLRSPEILERLRHALASRPEAAVAEMRAARR